MRLKPLESPHMLHHALNYARHGYKVFPCYEPFERVCTCGDPVCSSPGKHPRTAHGSKDATTDAAQIRAWWTECPNANIGIDCSSLIVIDVDAAKQGFVSLEKLETEFGKLPDTWLADTGGGGQHYFYRRNGHAAKNATNLRPGIDIKTDGGYIIASPSLHVSGKRYGCSKDSARELAPFPVEWLPLLNGGNADSTQKPRFDTAGALAGKPEGERDNACWKLACKLRNADVPIDMAMSLVLEAAGNCTPKFPEDQSREKVERAYRIYEPSENSKQDPNKGKPDNPFTPQEYWQQYDVADIKNWKCPDLEPIIDGILAKGNLLWLAAETQTGKTLFMLWVCLQLLNKGSLFDRFAIAPLTRILYIACEDPARRFKGRLLEMIAAAIEAGRFIVYVAPGFSIADVLCFQFLENMIQEGGFDLVVIDTFQAATMGVSSFDDEKLSIIIQHLLGITRKLGTTIVVNDHFRKTQNHKKRNDLDLNDVKGSGVKLQNADVYLLMDRHNGQLRISGKSKEWDRPIGFLLDIAPQGSTGAKFTYAGSLEELVGAQKQKGKENRERILQAIGDDWSTREDVERRVSLGRSTVSKHITALFDDGLLEKKGNGKAIYYRIASVRDENSLWTQD